MKKLLLALSIVCLCLTGCSANESADAPEVKEKDESIISGVTYDYVEYGTIEEINETAGVNLVSAPVSGKSDEKFGVISNSIAQYTFKCNGEDWCLRASTDIDNDISGLYYDNVAFEKDVTGTYYNDDVYVFRFFYNDVQYVISLDVKDKDISMGHFDDVCNEFKTNITGVKSGYETELVEEGDDVIYRATMYNDDGTVIVTETVYSFENDKMVSIINKTVFESEEALKEYCDMLVEAGVSLDNYTFEGSTIISDSSSNLDFYSDMSKEEFVSSMQSSLDY